MILRLTFLVYLLSKLTLLLLSDLMKMDTSNRYAINEHRFCFAARNGVPVFAPDLPESLCLNKDAVSRDFLFHKCKCMMN